MENEKYKKYKKYMENRENRENREKSKESFLITHNQFDEIRCQLRDKDQLIYKLTCKIRDTPVTEIIDRENTVSNILFSISLFIVFMIFTTNLIFNYKLKSRKLDIAEKIGTRGLDSLESIAHIIWDK